MKDKHLLAAALTCSLIGLLALFVLYSTQQVEISPIEKVKLMADEPVSIKGSVTQVIQHENLTMIRVGYDTSIDVVLFGNSDVRRGDTVLVTGKAQEYQGHVEIVGEKVTVER